jgi:hypothetical protein
LAVERSFAGRLGIESGRSGQQRCQAATLSRKLANAALC